MSLAEGRTVDDPLTKALKNGKVPTLKDVKLSLKVSCPCAEWPHILTMYVFNRRSSKLWYKQSAIWMYYQVEWRPDHFLSQTHWITSTGRRFATFKLFYTDETPAEYEPPYFESGDAERDKWYFMTHDMDEVPERTTIGKIHTGHHSSVIPPVMHLCSDQFLHLQC